MDLINILFRYSFSTGLPPDDENNLNNLSHKIFNRHDLFTPITLLRIVKY